MSASGDSVIPAALFDPDARMTPLDIPTFATFTVLLRAPVQAEGRHRAWSGHCLDLDLGAAAQNAPALRRRLAASIAAHVSLAGSLRARRAAPNRALWEMVRHAPVVALQTVETELGPVEVRYVQPFEVLTSA